MSTLPLGNVLVTGAGGPSGVNVMRSLREHADLVAADIDPFAVGLYLVPPDRRVLLPRGDDPAFVEALLSVAVEQGVDGIVPTVDTELLRIAEQADRFAEAGIAVLVESVETLRMCVDKFALMQACREAVRVPRTILLDSRVGPAQLADLGEPFIIKPRSGAGSRGFQIVATAADLDSSRFDGSFIAQELLPGEEYSIDVLCRAGEGVVAAVPRRRDKVDSGIAVAARTVADPRLEEFGRTVADVIGARFVVNVQAKLDTAGRPALLEVNARVPGTMCLTQAAGIDMPLLAMRALRGQEIPARLDFHEVAVVRHWEEVVVPIEEYAQVRSADRRLDGQVTGG